MRFILSRLNLPQFWVDQVFAPLLDLTFQKRGPSCTWYYGQVS